MVENSLLSIPSRNDITILILQITPLVDFTTQLVNQVPFFIRQKDDVSLFILVKHSHDLMLIECHGVRVWVLNRNFSRISIILVVRRILFNYPELHWTTSRLTKSSRILFIKLVIIACLLSSPSFPSFSSFAILSVKLVQIRSKSYWPPWCKCLSHPVVIYLPSLS